MRTADQENLAQRSAERLDLDWQVMVFRFVISNGLPCKLSSRWSYSDRKLSRDSRRRVHERLNESRFMADLSPPSSPLSIPLFINLEPGLCRPKIHGNPLSNL
jgi:hypothetical protein